MQPALDSSCFVRMLAGSSFVLVSLEEMVPPSQGVFILNSRQPGLFQSMLFLPPHIYCRVQYISTKSPRPSNATLHIHSKKPCIILSQHHSHQTDQNPQTPRIPH